MGPPGPVTGFPLPFFYSRINFWHLIWHILLRKAHREEQNSFSYSTDSRVLWNRKFITVSKTVRHWSCNQPDQHNTPLTTYFYIHLILLSYQRLGLLKESEKTVAGNVWPQEIYLRILHKTIATKCVLYLDTSGWVDYISRAEGHEQAGIRTIFTREENKFFSVLLTVNRDISVQ
jgi:hypothetical protein